jgi:hypothetical protein
VMRHAFFCLALITVLALGADARAEVSDLLCIGSVTTGNDGDPVFVSGTPLLLRVEPNAIEIKFGGGHTRLAAMHYSDHRVTNDGFSFGADAFLLHAKTGQFSWKVMDGSGSEQRWFKGVYRQHDGRL